jgi:hypothetical protein
MLVFAITPEASWGAMKSIAFGVLRALNIYISYFSIQKTVNSINENQNVCIKCLKEMLMLN